MMTQSTLLVLAVWRPVCDDIKKFWLKCKKDLTPIAAAKQAGDFISRRIVSAAITNLRRKFFAVRLAVAVPAGQGGVAGVGKKKGQRRRFDVAVAKDHVGFASHGVAIESSPR
jgi:hypothetical protein